jgi:predicted nucleotidyltransferase
MATSPMPAEPAEDPLLRRLRAELEQHYGDRLQAVLLYGSRARGEARPDSDWDVAVILKDYDGSRAERHRLADLAFDLMVESGKVLSLLPLAPGELEKRTLFIHNLRQEAVPV